jgi:hypothetical protein
MSSAQRVLILTAVLLIGCTMAFGVGYAIFDEHQTLQAMGVNLATAFVEASQNNMQGSHAALESYAAVGAEYLAEIHSHGHWGMLSLVLIALALSFDKLGLSDKQGLALAWLLALSAVFFPLGVLLQIGPAGALGKLLSVPASMGMVAGMLITAWCLLRNQ